eukprot:scpid66771/ scgid32981/ ADAMTS-like protein 3; Punctin-2
MSVFTREILLGLSTVILLIAATPCSAQPEWRAGSFHTDCTQTCGGGVQMRTTRCATKSGKTLPDKDCAHLGPRPPAFKDCNRQDCPPRIFRHAWSTCVDCFRNRTVECRVRQNNGYNRIVPLSMCGVRDKVERDVCRHGPGCWVIWKSHAFPCCHASAAQGYACVDETDKILPDWICHKLQYVGNLKIPQPAACIADATCQPPTAEPTTPPTTEPATEAIHVPDIEDADPTDPVESSKTVVVGLGKYPLIPKTEVIPFTTSKSSLDAVDRVNGGKKLSGKDGAKTSSEAGCTRPISQLLVAMTGIAMAMILLA